MRIAAFSAFPHELRHLVKSFAASKHSLKCHFPVASAFYRSHEILFVQTGLGTQNAEMALNYIFKESRPDYILSMGFGGALYKGAVPGDLIWASKIFSLTQNSIESVDIPGAEITVRRLSGKVILQEKSIITLDRWMPKSEIEKILPRDFPSLVCDMETYPLAKLAIREGIPFFAVRSITDRIDEDIPQALLDVCDKAGNYSCLKAFRLLLRQPNLVPMSIRLGRNSSRASKNLALAVISLIDIL